MTPLHHRTLQTEILEAGSSCLFGPVALTVNLIYHGFSHCWEESHIYVCVCVHVRMWKWGSGTQKAIGGRNMGWILWLSLQKESFFDSIASSWCCALQSFPLISVSSRTQWINQIPARLFHFPLFSTLALQLFFIYPSAPEETCTWEVQLAFISLLGMLFRKIVTIYRHT